MLIVAVAGVIIAGLILTGGVAYAQTTLFSSSAAASSGTAGPSGGNSTVSMLLQDITQTINEIIAEENTPSSSEGFIASGEASQLIVAVSGVQAILAGITPNTIATPFH